MGNCLNDRSRIANSILEDYKSMQNTKRDSWKSGVSDLKKQLLIDMLAYEENCKQLRLRSTSEENNFVFKSYKTQLKKQGYEYEDLVTSGRYREYDRDMKLQSYITGCQLGFIDVERDSYNLTTKSTLENRQEPTKIIPKTKKDKARKIKSKKKTKPKYEKSQLESQSQQGNKQAISIKKSINSLDNM